MADLALKMMGVACAAGSVWFAAHMFTHQEGGPRINAMEDFGLFAQPSRVHAVEAAVRATAVENAVRKSGRAISIDMTPVGAASSHASNDVAPTRRDQRPDAKADTRIAELSDQEALLETPDGYRRVAVGDEIPEIGKIIALRRLDQYWIVVGSLRSLAQMASPPGTAAARP